MDDGRDNDSVRPQPAETVAVAHGDELDPAPRGRRRRRGLIAIALIAVVAIVGLAVAVALMGSDEDSDPRVTSTDLDTPAAQRVLAALGTATAAGSFTATYEIHTEPSTQAPRRVDAPTCPPPTPATPG